MESSKALRIAGLINAFESNVGKTLTKAWLIRNVPGFSEMSPCYRYAVIRTVKKDLAAKGLLLVPNLSKSGGWTVVQPPATSVQRPAFTTTTTTTTTVPSQVQVPQHVPVACPVPPAKATEHSVPPVKKPVRVQAPMAKEGPSLDFVNKLMLTQCLDTLTALTDTYNKMIMLTLKETLEKMGVDANNIEGLKLK